MTSSMAAFSRLLLPRESVQWRQEDRLVWFEVYDDPTTAISREKEIKKWRRAWKLRLIEQSNPQWLDLYEQISQ